MSEETELVKVNFGDLRVGDRISAVGWYKDTCTTYDFTVGEISGPHVYDAHEYLSITDDEDYSYYRVQKKVELPTEEGSILYNVRAGLVSFGDAIYFKGSWMSYAGGKIGSDDITYAMLQNGEIYEK